MTDVTTRITDLDFDSIKANLTRHLSNQEHWAGYDFEASGLSVMVGQLAHAKHYDAFHANVMSAEMYLSSAELRSSVVDRASELSYTPRSVTAARALVDVEVREAGTELPLTIVIDKGTRFVPASGGGDVFTAVQTRSVTRTHGNPGIIRELDVRQGSYSSIEYVQNDVTEVDGMILPHSNIDTSLLEVYVQEGSDDARTRRYVEVEDVVDVDGLSRVYYLEESSDGRFRIRFGDGILGRHLPRGKVVRVVYFETSGSSGNGLDSFKMTTSGTMSKASVTVRSRGRSHGGAPAETIDSIKFHAPRHYSSHGRAVTTPDWKSIVLRRYQDVSSVKVWGGEDEEIPFGKHGSVYVALNPTSGGVLTESRKRAIVEDLRSVSISGLGRIVAVDPDVTWIVMGVTVSVDPETAPSDMTGLREKIRNALEEFSAKRLEKFDMDFEHSRASAVVDGVHESISSTEILPWAETRIVPDSGRETTYEVEFRNQVDPGSLTSNPFTWAGRVVQMRDRGGLIDFFKTDGESLTVVGSQMGTIDYETGRVRIDPVVIDRGNQTTKDLRIRVKPSSLNFRARMNKVLVVDTDSMRVDVRVKEENGRFES